MCFLRSFFFLAPLSLNLCLQFFFFFFLFTHTSSFSLSLFSLCSLLSSLLSSLSHTHRYVTLLKKNQRIEIGYKDGVKYWVRIKKLQLPPKKRIKSIISTLLEDRDHVSRKDTGKGTNTGSNTSSLSQHNYHLVIQYENDKSNEKVPYHFFLFRYVHLHAIFLSLSPPQ